MLIIYDNKGQVYFAGTGYPQPEGIPFLNVEVPEGKYLDGVDVSTEPHQAIFKDYPKSDIEILKEEVAELKAQNMALMEGVQSATGVNLSVEEE